MRLCYRMELGKEEGDGSFLSEINKLINSGLRYDRPTVTAHQSRGNWKGKPGVSPACWRALKNPMGLRAHRFFSLLLSGWCYLAWRTGMAFGTAAACAWRFWTVGAGFWN